MPHKDRVDADAVTSSKPLRLWRHRDLTGFSLRFSAGQVVKLTATHGKPCCGSWSRPIPVRASPAKCAAPAQLTHLESGLAVLQHPVRRERRKPCRARDGIQVHVERRRSDER